MRLDFNQKLQDRKRELDLAHGDKMAAASRKVEDWLSKQKESRLSGIRKEHDMKMERAEKDK